MAHSHTSRSSVLPFAAALAWALLTPAAQAASPVVTPDAASPRTLWQCSLSTRLTQLLCVMDNDEPAASDEADGGADATDAAPAEAQRLRVVDLWAPPSTATNLGVLARITLCSRSANCEVRLNLGDPWLGAARPPVR